MSGSVLEDKIADEFKRQGYIVFTRKNHCDVSAVKPDMALAYLVECKDYKLSVKQQRLAVRELNRNYVHALELLLQSHLHPQKMLQVLVAQGFSYQARNTFQYNPEAFLEHIQNR